MIQPSTVEISGISINEIIDFMPNGGSSATISFTIVNDDIALEATEAYILSLSIVGSDEVVVGLPAQQLYPSTVISIMDDDSKLEMSFAVCPYYILFCSC